MNFVQKLNEFMKNNALKQKDLIEGTTLSKSYISMVLRGERNPNKELLNKLSMISEKSITWWLNDADEYDNLYSLNLLIDRLIDEKCIQQGEPIPGKYLEMLHHMLNLEIDVKLENKKKAQH
jgi:transcriptional regulator with XRE-family HTH domain